MAADLEAKEAELGAPVLADKVEMSTQELKKLAAHPEIPRPLVDGRRRAGRRGQTCLSAGPPHGQRFGERNGRRRWIAWLSRRDTCIWLQPSRAAMRLCVSSSK